MTEAAAPSITPTLPDVVGGLSDALDIAVGVVAAICDDQWVLPTPCTQYDVRTLTVHLLGAVRRVRGIALNEPFGTLDETLDDRASLADQLRSAGDEALEAWRVTDLAGERTVPWATVPAGLMLEMYVMEILTHTWDLATATGQPNEWDPALGEAIVAAAPNHVPGQEYRGDETMPFGEVQEAPVGAGPFARLAAFLGRRP